MAIQSTREIHWNFEFASADTCDYQHDMCAIAKSNSFAVTLVRTTVTDWSLYFQEE